MTGLWIALGVVLLALAFGGYRHLTDGRARTVAAESVPHLDARRLGSELGAQATFVQFSSPVCTPCRAMRRILSGVVADEPDVGYVDIDAESRLDLVQEFGILRSPTVLVLDDAGAVRHRITGTAPKAEILDVLGQVRRTADLH
ncbi:MAG TPA: thioredoxin family protein [Arachnia sp.]|nr:thioredoxin family protein [Arachnia sp.]HMT87471.1 thioredoxin family protein [Arachnia sp.]